jgi:hypothetical protein
MTSQYMLLFQCYENDIWHYFLGILNQLKQCPYCMLCVVDIMLDDENQLRINSNWNHEVCFFFLSHGEDILESQILGQVQLRFDHMLNAILIKLKLRMKE